MSCFDIRGRHQHLAQCVPFPQVLCPIVIGYMGNEVVGKRFPQVHKGYVVGVNDNDIYYAVGNDVFVNETKLPIDGKDIRFIDKWTKGRYLVSYAHQCTIYDSNGKYDLENCNSACICDDKVYYMDGMSNLYEHSCKDDQRYITSGVVECGRVSNFLFYSCINGTRWMHHPVRNPITHDTISVHAYNDQYHYVMKNSLQSYRFRHDLLSSAYQSFQSGHCVWFKTRGGDYVWDLKMQTVYLLNQPIYCTIRNGQCYEIQTHSVVIYK